MTDERFKRLLALRKEAANLERDLGLELDAYHVPEIVDPLGLAAHRLLCEFGRDVIGIHSPNGKYLFVSGNCHRLLGWRPEEMIGRHPEDFFYDDEQPDAQPTHITYQHRCGDGSFKWVRTHVRENVVGETTQLVTITQDIHEEHVRGVLLHSYMN